MADINGKSLWLEKVSTFGIPPNTPKFQSDYLTALNRTLRRLKRLGDMRTAPTKSTNVESDVDFDEKYEDVVSSGIDFNLMLLGHKPRQSGSNKAFDVNTARQLYETLIDEFVMEVHHTLQADDSEDVIGGEYVE